MARSVARPVCDSYLLVFDGVVLVMQLNAVSLQQVDCRKSTQFVTGVAGLLLQM